MSDIENDEAEIVDEGFVWIERPADNVHICESQSFKIGMDIQSITSTWFDLMVLLNRSPEIRSFFSKEVLNEDGRSYTSLPTEHTRNFLTSGLMIYRIDKCENKGGYSFLKHVVITNDCPNQKELLHEVITFQSSREYKVYNIARWQGCGMKIPKNINIKLCPNKVWPSLTARVEYQGKQKEVTIYNKQNVLKYSETSIDDSCGPDKKGAVFAANKLHQGLTEGSVTVKGKIIGRPTLKLAYTCPSFDILTSIKLEDYDGDDNVILLTT